MACESTDKEEADMSQYVQDIDAALQRLVDLRRQIVPDIAIDPKAMDDLASIQDSLVKLVKARDQELALANNKSIAQAVGKNP